VGHAKELPTGKEKNSFQFAGFANRSDLEKITDEE
jgi:hypothetical protein